RPAHIDQLLVGTGRDRDGAGERADGGDGAEHPVDPGLGLFGHQIAAVRIGLGGQLGLDLEITQAGIDAAAEEAVEGLGMFGLVGVSRATHPADLERCQRGIGLVEGLLQGGDLGIDTVDLFGLHHIGHAGPDVGQFLVAFDLEVLKSLLQLGKDLCGAAGISANGKDPARTRGEFDTHDGFSYDLMVSISRWMAAAWTPASCVAGSAASCMPAIWLNILRRSVRETPCCANAASMRRWAWISGRSGADRLVSAGIWASSTTSAKPYSTVCAAVMKVSASISCSISARFMPVRAA